MKRSFAAENTLDSVFGLIHETKSYLKSREASTRALFITELVLEEILTNIVKYAYDDKATHSIEVVAEIVANQVILEIRDDGDAFDPLTAPPPEAGLPVQAQHIGGRGIQLVKTFVKQAGYFREDGWNILTLAFPLGAS
jgi:anti-sigma regulatory factor (Ser/Thr protein kinase)